MTMTSLWFLADHKELSNFLKVMKDPSELQILANMLLDLGEDKLADYIREIYRTKREPESPIHGTAIELKDGTSKYNLYRWVTKEVALYGGYLPMCGIKKEVHRKLKESIEVTDMNYDGRYYHTKGEAWLALARAMRDLENDLEVAATQSLRKS